MADIDLKIYDFRGEDSPVFCGDSNGGEISSPSAGDPCRLYYCFASEAADGQTRNFDVTLSINGNLFTCSNVTASGKGLRYSYYYYTLSFQPGTYTIKMVIDPENRIAETDETNNVFTKTITVPGASGQLMDTFWSQSGVFLGDSRVNLNDCCPIEPGSSTHAVTGCNNTAAAQMLYYFAENGHQFTLQLNDDDKNTANPSITIDSSAANASRYSYLPFSEVNARLQEFDTDSAEDAAALVFASGVIANAKFGTASTSTNVNGIKQVFERAGFHSIRTAWRDSDLLDSSGRITEAGWQMLKRNIAAGLPVFTSLVTPSHAVVIDGYDQKSDSVHFNFGWGFTGNKTSDGEYGSGWFTRTECEAMDISGFIYDITPDTEKPEIVVSISKPAAGDVVLTAGFTDDVGVYGKYYQLHTTAGKWLEYTGAVTVHTNGEVFFKAVDKAKNTTIESVKVTGLTSVLEDNIVTGGQQLQIGSGTTGCDTVVYSGGTVAIYAGGEHKGSLQINSGASVNVSAGGIIDFTVSGRSSSDGYLINDLSRITGSPRYTVTVDDDQAYGSYRLAQGAKDFSGTLYLRNGRDDLGELQINGGFLIHDGKIYTLAQNGGDLTLTISEQDLTPPEIVVSGIPDKKINCDAVLTVSADEECCITYQIGDGQWLTYTGCITIESQATVNIKAADLSGNVTRISVDIDMIDKEKPLPPSVAADITSVTNNSVAVSASFAEDSVLNEYRIGDGQWLTYTGVIRITANSEIQFRSRDEAGNYSDTVILPVKNIDNNAPEVPGGLTAEGYCGAFSLSWNSCDDHGTAGVDGYFVRFGTDDDLTGDGKFFCENKISLDDLPEGRYWFQARSRDRAGNLSEWSEKIYCEIKGEPPTELKSSLNRLSWSPVTGADRYIVKIFSGYRELSILSDTAKLNIYALPKGDYQWQVATLYGTPASGNDISTVYTSVKPQLLKSDADSNKDIFFANNIGKWGHNFFAVHRGYGSWEGTGEKASVTGKNRCGDMFRGSDDANILLLTDDENGDTLFVDDIFTGLPESIGEQQSRLYMIDEIRAGAGDDVVDMTSREFSYYGRGITIYGGDGNDIIWANQGENILFGDAGNDRITGGSDNDIIIGGSGNDILHGGGGNDIFCFGGDWGCDIIEQLDGGSVTLFFESYDENCWQKYENMLVYTDGSNSVTIKNPAVKLTAKDADSAPEEFAAGDKLGAFDDHRPGKIFVSHSDGILA